MELKSLLGELLVLSSNELGLLSDEGGSLSLSDESDSTLSVLELSADDKLSLTIGSLCELEIADSCLGDDEDCERELLEATGARLVVRDAPPPEHPTSKEKANIAAITFFIIPLISTVFSIIPFTGVNFKNT